ncbi:MAG: hypothetical protein K6D37_13105 [Prevotella sp.]|nr:hypothetical protein [Prevotella sp.]
MSDDGQSVRLTGVGAALHFLVDGLCACCLFLLADGTTGLGLLGAFLIYNVLAFLTQPLTGMLADRIYQPGLLLQGAVALLAFGVAVASFVTSRSSLLAPHFPLLTSIFLGMGNSLFHVWGGRQVALATSNDIRALGVFVSTGAFGLAVGMVFCSWWLLYVLLALIVLLTIYILRDRRCYGRSNAPSCARPWLAWCTVLLLMGFVMFRSFVGASFTAGLAKGSGMMLLIGALAMTGKALGGWVVRGGWGFAVVLACVAACLLLTASVGWLWLPGLLFINGTMAITLYWANSALPGREGLAFGLLAAALMPGYLLAQASQLQALTSHSSFLISSLLLTLLPTIAIELLVLWSLRERRADVLGSSVVVNLLTNVPLHLFLVFVSSSVTAIVAGEMLVLVIEMLWYRYFVSSWRQAFMYSFLCNGISCLTGLLVQLVSRLCFLL